MLILMRKRKRERENFLLCVCVCMREREREREEETEKKVFDPSVYHYNIIETLIISLSLTPVASPRGRWW